MAQPPARSAVPRAGKQARCRRRQRVLSKALGIRCSIPTTASSFDLDLKLRNFREPLARHGHNPFWPLDEGSSHEHRARNRPGRGRPGRVRAGPRPRAARGALLRRRPPGVLPGYRGPRRAGPWPGRRRRLAPRAGCPRPTWQWPTKVTPSAVGKSDGWSRTGPKVLPTRPPRKTWTRSRSQRGVPGFRPSAS